MKKGIDLSTFQKNVDYKKLKEQGIEFAIIRCGYGKERNQKDAEFETHYRGLKSVGIKVGAYLYSYCTAVENAKLEGENCLYFISGKEFELPIFIDLEENRTKELGRVCVTQIAKTFCEIIENAGYKAGVYANLDWFRNYIDVSQLSDYSIWLAQWNDKYTADFRVDFWQYTNSGKIDGISGNVDLDYAYIDFDNTTNKENNYTTGRYIVNVDTSLNVRKSPSLSGKILTFYELTSNARKQILQKRGYSVNGLVNGVECDVLNIVYADGYHWGKIPSGYIALEYCKKV